MPAVAGSGLVASCVLRSMPRVELSSVNLLGGGYGREAECLDGVSARTTKDVGRQESHENRNDAL